MFVGERKILYEDADGTARVSVHVFSQDDTGRVTSYLRMYKKEDEEGAVWENSDGGTRNRAWKTAFTCGI